MRFLDANIFIYAYYRPKGTLGDKELHMKNLSKQIIERINKGTEEVMTTVVHLSEVANILKYRMSNDSLLELFLGLYSRKNVIIKSVLSEEYLLALELASEENMEPNDALALHFMRNEDIKEIYTFDTNFEKVSDIIKLPII